MRLVFSEATPDYARYAFPYAVWGFPEPGETPADFLEAGFLPSSVALDRFYLCRQLRVPLEGWIPNTENRRILRKADRWVCRLVPRSEYVLRPEMRSRWLEFARVRFGEGVMPGDRLDRLMAAPVVNHILEFRDPDSEEEVGAVLMYLEAPRVAYYYFAFHVLDEGKGISGMQMMTRAVAHFSEAGFGHLHLGTCYDERALYKVQFEPMEYSTGWTWSSDLAALRALVRRPPTTGHLLEDPTHPAGCGTQPVAAARATRFRMSRP